MTVKDLNDLRVNGRLQVTDANDKVLFDTAKFNPVEEAKVEKMEVKKWWANDHILLVEV